MHISKIILKNFKGFKDLTFECNKSFNVIIGENNIGKSTIFEALLLWKDCYERIITAKRTSFYKADGGNTYIPFSELSFVRLINDTDLFNEPPNKARITIVIKKDEHSFNLTFEISKPISISDSYLRFKTISHREFERFANHLKELQIKLDQAFFIYQTKPVSNILNKEPFMNTGQVLKKISLGKSGEVLRNKIVSKTGIEKTRLEEKISSVLGKDFQLHFLNESRAHFDEYIDLKVQNGERKLDIHLQGSGFLQVAEIFSTIGYLENTINILLIDEPDSHIHVKLQKKLLRELRGVEKTQTFVISHNDSFVSELQSGELFYLNQEGKEEGKIKKLEIDNFDLIKKELGGIIVALDKLNSTDRICFVEGDDDISYIELLLSKYLACDATLNVSKGVVFYFIRGKDYLLTKLDFNKRLLSQLFKDKKFVVVYDKDYSTEVASANLDIQIKNKLGQGSKSLRHIGYCIESTLFSELDKLKGLLSISFDLDENDVSNFVNEYIANVIAEFSTHTSELYIQFEVKFKSQKTAARVELENVEFNDFLREALVNGNEKVEYLFNKPLIADFVKKFRIQFIVDCFNEEESDEYLASSLFKLYINKISSIGDILDTNKTLLNEIFDIN